MYLRPGHLKKDFVIEKKKNTLNAKRRPVSTYDTDSSETLQAVLAQATPLEKERWKQTQHPISHIITQTGSPKAGIEDRLVFGNRIFLVQGVDDPGALGHFTLYYVEERFDMNG